MRHCDSSSTAACVVLPVIAVYTIGVYWVFRGKVRKGYGRGA